ncbi:MAG: MetQ/NlpA family ABC transporter substrate-binding protein, partial [Dialister micraerophilus]|nr:MetQ/NlpA family ABC transporter substrate-binding protein [Dialister micraerophilus]
LPRSLDDVDASVITMNFVQSAGISPQEKGIFFEDKDNPLAVMIIATRAKDKDNENYKTFVSAYQSDAVKQFIKETLKGTIEAAWN